MRVPRPTLRHGNSTLRRRDMGEFLFSLLSGLWGYSEIIAICKPGSGSSPDTDLELPSLCNSGKYIVV